MKTKFILVLVAFVFILYNVSYSQVGILRRQINRAINKEIDNKVDSAIEKSEKDSQKAREKEAEQADQKAEQGKTTSRGGLGILGGKTDIKHNDEYAFTGRIYMQMESYDKKDVLKSDYFMYFNANTLNAGIEVKYIDPKEDEQAIPTVFLFDNDNRCFMMLIETSDSKTGIISTIPNDSTLVPQGKTQKGEQAKKPMITKTGNTRTIAGYRCDEYKIVEPDEDGYANVWMTKDVKLKADKKNWGKAGIPTYYNYPGFEGAMMLAMESFDKNNNPEMKMETKEINENFKHSISTVGCAFIKMNFGQAGRK